MSPTFHSLRLYNYRTYAAGQLLSNTGTWMQRVAQDWLVLTLTGGSGLALGITTALQFAPFLALALYGGTLADRFGRRRLLLLTQTASGALALALGILTLAGHAQVWHVFVFAVALGIVNALDNPARQAFVSELVGRDDLANAVALNSASFNLGRVLGPAVAGLMVAAVGSGWVFLVNAASYAVTVGTLLALRPSEFRPRRHQVGPVRLTQGLVYLRSRSDLLLVMLLVAAVATFGFNFAITLALMASAEFGRGAEALGLMSTALACGSLVGSLLAARRGATSLRLVVTAGLIFAVLEATVGLMPSYTSFLLALPIVGVAALTFSTAAQSYLQLRSEGWVRGRVMGVYTLAFFGGAPIGAPIIGALSDHLGPRVGLVGGGILAVLAITMATTLLWRRANESAEQAAQAPVVETGVLPVVR